MNQAPGHLNRPTDENHIAAMFNRIAPRYDFLNRLLSVRQDQRWRKLMIKEVPHQPEGILIDMATGTGDVAIMAAKLHPEYSAIHGFDISEGMLALAQKKSRAENSAIAQRLHWAKCSAEQIAADDASADAVTIAFGLRNVVNKERALQEFARVLKPEGRLLILEFFMPESSFLSRLFLFYFHHILPLVGRLFSEKAAYEYLPKSVESFYSSKELEQVLSQHELLVYKNQSFLFGSCRLVCAVRTVQN